MKKKLPKDNELPYNTFATKKVVCPLGLEMQKIHDALMTACTTRNLLIRDGTSPSQMSGKRSWVHMHDRLEVRHVYRVII